MNAPVFWRLVWKEYRRLRGFWIGVAVLAVLLDLLALAFGPPDAHLGNVQGQLLGFMFAVALGASALYAVGAAAVIFAAEREEKTFAFLNILPSNPWPVMGGKMAAAGASALALAVILSLAGFAFAGWRVPDGILAGRLLAWLGVAILEMLAWGIFCSLLLKQPLVASLLAIFLASCGASLAVTLTVPNAAGRANVQAYADAMFYRLIFVALVATLDGYLARH